MSISAKLDHSITYKVFLGCSSSPVGHQIVGADSGEKSFDYFKYFVPEER